MGDRKKKEYAAYGVPSCVPPIPNCSSPVISFLGNKRTTFGLCIEFTTMRLLISSIATLPQFIPPATPGYSKVPSVLGGVSGPS